MSCYTDLCGWSGTGLRVSPALRDHVIESCLEREERYNRELEDTEQKYLLGGSDDRPESMRSTLLRNMGEFTSNPNRLRSMSSTSAMSPEGLVPMSNLDALSPRGEAPDTDSIVEGGIMSNPVFGRSSMQDGELNSPTSV